MALTYRGEVGAPGTGALRKPFAVLSDGTQAAVVRKSSAPYAYTVRASYNGGVTWVDAVTLPSTIIYLWTTNIGDAFYFAECANAVSIACKFYRVTYTPATRTWDLAVNGTTIAALNAGLQYITGFFGKEPGGRVWCALTGYAPGWGGRCYAYYSDTDGATWIYAQQIDRDSYNSVGWYSDVVCFEKNTIIVLSWTDGIDAALIYRKHLHTDPVGTWSSYPVWLQVMPTLNVHDIYLEPEHASPVKRAFVVLQDTFATPRKIYGVRINEDTGGTLTSTQLGTLSAPAGESGEPQVSGRTNGWVVTYHYSGSVSTLRRRAVHNTNTSWPSETTEAIPITVNGQPRFRPARTLNAAYNAAVHGYAVTEGNGGSELYHVTVANEGLSTSISRIFHLEFEATGWVRRAFGLPMDTHDGWARRGFGLPMDNLRPAIRAFRLPVAYDPTTAVARALMIPLEFQGGVGSWGALPVEWDGAHVVRNWATIPVEVLGGIGSLLCGAPLDVLATVGTAPTGRHLPVEVLAGATRGVHTPVEWTGMRYVILSARLPVESRMRLQRGTKIPIEWSGVIVRRVGKKLPVEFRSIIQARRKLPAEWAGTSMVFMQEWDVSYPLSTPLMTSWIVVPVVKSFSVLHGWDVKQLLGGQMPTTWRVLPLSVLGRFSDDIQLPVGTVEIIE
jgi:hypothetical protein